MRFEDDDISQLALDGGRQMRQGPDVYQFLVDDLQIVRRPIVSPIYNHVQIHTLHRVLLLCWISTGDGGGVW